MNKIQSNMLELTKAEEQIMRILWDLEKGFVRDIIREIPAPKPAYNTVSTIVRILERKGFVSYLAFGKTHRYYPLISKEEYTKYHMYSFVKNYFSDSFGKMVSFFAREKSLSIREMEEIMQLMKKEIEEQKS